MTPTRSISQFEQLWEILSTMNPDSPEYLVTEMADVEVRFIHDLGREARRDGSLDITVRQAEWLADIHHKVYWQAHPRKT